MNISTVNVVQSQRNTSVDAIKVIAMTMVLLLHTGVSSASFIDNSNSRDVVYAICCIAVPLFFMASGYLMQTREVSLAYVKKKVFGILKFIIITISLALIVYNLIDYINNGRLTSRGLGIASYFSWTVQKGYMWQYWYFGAMILLYIINALIPNEILFSYKILSIMVLASFMAFILNALCQFEKMYLPQTFRLYYWVMFYCMGGVIRKKEKSLTMINWLWVLLVSIVYVIFQCFGPDLGGNEFYFGSVLCMVYAVCVFCACLNTVIKNGGIINLLSSLFLPVYALHVLFYDILKFLGIGVNVNQEWGFLVLCIVHCTLTILLCWMLMRIKFMKKIFKI